MDAPSEWFDTNALQLEKEMEWLELVLETRLKLHFGQETKYQAVEEIEVPALISKETPFGDFVSKFELNAPERLLLALALAPQLRPQILDPLGTLHGDKSPIAETGAFRGQVHKGIIPTFETALFLVAGTSIHDRIVYQSFFSKENELFKGGWLRLQKTVPVEPPASALLIPSDELVSFITTGEMGDPEFGTAFPAEKIQTKREWSELILPNQTMDELQEVLAWIKHEKTVMQDWGLGRTMMPGFRVLFHGAPGTGKTFATTLMGKEADREVYRIDLSTVVSKYIGETEKNLKSVFDKAQSRNWILFFDEADALFGKRTSISDSKDRFANQEVSYLLQRVETFDGVVILATNNRENLDKAFTRRFQSVIEFPIPSVNERLRLWDTSLPETLERSDDINLGTIASRFELTGGNIMNVVRHVALRAAKRGKPVIVNEDIVDGVRKEYRKTGKIMK